MRFIDVHKSFQRFEPTTDQLKRLSSWLTLEIEDALSSRKALERVWLDLLRQYEGVPKNPVRNFPVENAPNVEVTLGAIASDAIYAQIVDLVYGTRPFVTCRPIPKRSEDKEYSDAVKALQRFANYVTDTEADTYFATDNAILDNVQLGTGVLYVPWTSRLRKTRVARISHGGPRMRCIPIEDVIIPGGVAGSIDEIPWIGLRFWPTLEEVNERAYRSNWDTSGISPAGPRDWVRQRREAIGRHTEGIQRKGKIYELLDVYAYYDIDEDGINEDLYVVFDRTSRNILYASYSPYDRRPISKFVYQRRQHMSYGLGVLQMVQPYQEELTDLHNYQTLNVLLANCRLWKGREGRIPDNMKIWPNRVIPLMDPDDLQAEQLADIYPSLGITQMMVTALAERRVGVNEISLPRNAGTVMGNRTPATTTVSLLQQQNKRFTPAFMGVREGIAEAIRQCLYRYQERILAGDVKVMAHIVRVLGAIDGYRVVGLLRNPDFDEGVIVELSAASAVVNREADRQNSIILAQILTQYYRSVLQLMAIASSPQTPPAVVDVARKIAEASGEVIERTIRTFDQVRDPALFVIEVNDEIDRAAAEAPEQALRQLFSIIGGGQEQQGRSGLPAMLGGPS